MSFRSDYYGAISNDLESISYKQSTRTIIPYIDVYRGIAVVFMLLINAQQSFPRIKVFRLFHLSTWNEISIADLTASLFIFIMGLCVYYSMTKALCKNSSKKSLIIKKIFKRFFLMILIGLLLNYIYMPLFNLSTILSIRVPSYLGRISFCYLILCLGHIAGITYLIAIIGVMFFLYIYFAHFYLVPFCGLNNITPFCFCGSFFDQFLFTRYHSKYPNDPQGLLGSVSALYTAFNGYLISYLITENIFGKEKGVLPIIIVFFFNSILLCVFYFVFNIPINASIYSSSFALWASTICSILYFLLYCLFQLPRNNRFISNLLRLLKPLVWLGKNSIMIYILSEVINCIFARIIVQNRSLGEIIVDKISLIFVHNDKLAGLIYSLVLMIIWLTLAYLSHVKKCYFKLR